MRDMAPSRGQIEDAAEACKQQIIKQKDTMTMKIARGMLETQLELPAGSLKAVKDTVAQVIDQLLVKNSEPMESTSPDEASRRRDGSDVNEQQETDEDADEDAEQDENCLPQRKRKSDPEPRQKAKKKVTAAPTGKASGNRKLEALKAICAKAGIRPPPSVYKQTDDAARIRALEQFMEGKGLSRHSTPAEITAVKRSLEREKDLEGIDMSNIVSGGRRSRQQSAAQPVNYRAMVGSDSEADSEPESVEDEQDPASQPADSCDPSEVSAREASDVNAASEPSGNDSDAASAGRPEAPGSPAATGAKDAHSPGFKGNEATAASSGGVREDGKDAAAEVDEDPPGSAPPPAPKRRAIVSESDDE